MSDAVRPERSGWRDEALSRRHRAWGWDCPAIDIDFLMCEYNHGKAVALVEYKQEHAAPQVASHPSYRALTDLADRAGLPLFAVRYAVDFSWWRVVPLNSIALGFLPQRVELTERAWVEFLYHLRGLTYPEASDNDIEF